MTTQSAADILGCSRDEVVRLIDRDEIHVGKDRRLKLEEVEAYKARSEEDDS